MDFKHRDDDDKQGIYYMLFCPYAAEYHPRDAECLSVSLTSVDVESGTTGENDPFANGTDKYE